MLARHANRGRASWSSPISDTNTAREWLAEARGAVVLAGAGMGVDSGLPDFRGSEGFWNAYPAYRKLGLDFMQLANPSWFTVDPALAWGFYGHRLQLYRNTKPHEGFMWLRQWASSLRQGLFVVTSNVDGHFQRAGLESVTEVHGSIHFVQCLRECRAPAIRPALFNVEVDPETCRAIGPLPTCDCGALLRPNILMFGDGGWISSRTDAQLTNFREFTGRDATGLVAIEIGAGTAVATIRSFSNALVQKGARLIRINPRDADVARGQIGLPFKARDGLRALLR